MDPDQLASRMSQIVFPAPAGMDLRGNTWTLIAYCFPRTRGDGPQVLDAALGLIKFSPHPRGWTVMGS